MAASGSVAQSCLSRPELVGSSFTPPQSPDVLIATPSLSQDERTCFELGEIFGTPYSYFETGVRKYLVSLHTRSPSDAHQWILAC